MEFLCFVLGGILKILLFVAYLTTPLNLHTKVIPSLCTILDNKTNITKMGSRRILRAYFLAVVFLVVVSFLGAAFFLVVIFFLDAVVFLGA